MTSSGRSAAATFRALEESREQLAERLRQCLPEIESAVAARVYGISDPQEIRDSNYLEGLRTSLTIALEYALSAIEQGEVRAPRVPPGLLAQARVAARHAVDLDVVIRRYLAGFSLIVDFALREVDGMGTEESADVQRLLRGQTALFDRLIEEVTAEYRKEKAVQMRSQGQRRTERIRRLLAGEPLDPSELQYDLDHHHLGIVVEGQSAADYIRHQASRLDRRLLLVNADDDGSVWAWLGGRSGFDQRILAEIASKRHRDIRLALGEPARGLQGWRLTHRQAKAALPFARRSDRRFARYSEVAVLATLRSDELLVTSLREIYLAPLEAERDGGQVARETLWTYLTAERNVSSAAAALGVQRHTVTRRLRGIEGTLGRALSTCLFELEVALRLDRLEKLS